MQSQLVFRENEPLTYENFSRVVFSFSSQYFIFQIAGGSLREIRRLFNRETCLFLEVVLTMVLKIVFFCPNTCIPLRILSFTKTFCRPHFLKGMNLNSILTRKREKMVDACLIAKNSAAYFSERYLKHSFCILFFLRNVFFCVLKQSFRVVSFSIDVVV